MCLGFGDCEYCVDDVGDVCGFGVGVLLYGEGLDLIGCCEELFVCRGWEVWVI